MAQKIQMRRDSVENWLDVNPILARGEWGVAFDGTSTDVIAIKIGDGESDWESLQSLLPIVVGYIAESRLDDETGFNAYDGEGALSIVLWADLESGVTVFVWDSGRVCTADGEGAYTTVTASQGQYHTEDGVVAYMPEVGTPSILSPTSSGGAVDSVNGQTGTVVLTAADVGTLDSGGITTVASGYAADALSDANDYTDTAVAGKQAADADLTAIAALAPSDDALIQRKSGAWTSRTPAQVKADLGVSSPVAPFFINYDTVYGGGFGRGVPGVDISSGNNGTNSGNWSTTRTIGMYFKVEAPISVATLEANVVTLESGKTFRMALAPVNNNGQPTSILYDSGDISTTTTGIKVATPGSPITLAAGWYVRLFRSNTTSTCTWRAADERMNHGNSAWGVFNPLRMAVMVGGSYGAFSTPPVFDYAVGSWALIAPLVMMTWSVI